MVSKTGLSGDTIICVRLSHPRNGLLPISITPSGMVTLVRESHALNALSPMVVTLSGMVTLVRELQE